MIVIVGCDKIETAPTSAVYQVECQLPNGKVERYTTQDWSPDSRGLFIFETTNGKKVYSTFCHMER